MPINDKKISELGLYLLRDAAEVVAQRLKDVDADPASLKQAVDQYQTLEKAIQLTSDQGAIQIRRLKFAVGFLIAAMLLTVVVWYLPFSTVAANPIRATIYAGSLTLTSKNKISYNNKIYAKAIQVVGAARTRIPLTEEVINTTELTFAAENEESSLYDLMVDREVRFTMSYDDTNLRLSTFGNGKDSTFTVDSSARISATELETEHLYGPYDVSELYEISTKNAGTSVILTMPVLKDSFELRGVLMISFEQNRSDPNIAPSLSTISAGQIEFVDTGETFTFGSGDFFRLGGNIDLSYVDVSIEDSGFRIDLAGSARQVSIGRRDLHRRVDPSLLTVINAHAGVAVIWSTLIFLFGSFWSLREISKGAFK